MTLKLSSDYGKWEGKCLIHIIPYYKKIDILNLYTEINHFLVKYATVTSSTVNPQGTIPLHIYQSVFVGLNFYYDNQ